MTALVSLAAGTPALAGTFVYVSNAEDGDIATYGMKPDGELQPGARAKAALLLWTRLSEWRFGPNDPLSSLGLVIIAGVVAVGLVEWLQDWRMLRTLRRHLACGAVLVRVVAFG